MHHLFSRWATVAGLLIPILAAGCGTDEYEKLMAERLIFLERQSRFDLLYKSTTLTRVADGDQAEQVYPISLRLPKLFKKDYWFTKGSKYHDGREIPKDRLNPSFLDEFPGLLLMCEAGVKLGERNYLKYNCYVGVVDANETSAQELQDELARQINSTTRMSIEYLSTKS